MTQTWKEANEWERQWHDDCLNSFQEESKQIEYMKRMGILPEGKNGRYPVYDFNNKSVIDIGGGAYSVLLKGINMINPTVVDPCDYPQWTKDRYKAGGINFVNVKAEDYCEGHYDVGIIYNCLQHTENPEKIISNMRKMCDMIYIHEWLDTTISDGHIQTIRESDLNKWLDSKGMVGYERWNESTVTPYYYGLFIS
jgi:2-polyprenyl-3-methyl-5-hydroxy-6-metoxy-1,4-benzoquinol methylase